jgi:hypothetical protein
MADVFMSRERIRNAAIQAVSEKRGAKCPPEFAPHHAVWFSEYWNAIEDAFIASNRLPAAMALSLAAELQAG